MVLMALSKHAALPLAPTTPVQGPSAPTRQPRCAQPSPSPGLSTAVGVAGAAAAAAGLARRRQRQCWAARSRAGPAVGRRIAEVSEPAAAAGEGLFQPWAEWFEAHFVGEFELREEVLPDHLARRRGHGSGSGALIQGRLLVGEADSPIRRVRITMVDDGDKLQAFNASVYPSHSLGPLPVLGIDVLTFNNHKRLLFGVDWSPMVPGEEYAEANIGAHVGEVRTQNAELAMEPSGKLYGELPEFFSPYMFFSRPSGAEDLRADSALWAVYCEYCIRYSSMLKQASAASAEARGRAEARQADYDKWHAERDPAMPIFRRLFGEAWTEEYVSRVLFPGSVQSQSCT